MQAGQGKSASRGRGGGPRRNTLGKVALVVLASVSLGACGQAGERTVVRVGKSVITEGELRRWASVLVAAERPKPREGVRVRDQALQFLIRARWVEEAARSDHIVVEGREINELLTLVLYAQRRTIPAVPYGWKDELEQYVASPVATPAEQSWLMSISLLHTKLERRDLEHAEGMIARTRVVRYYDEKRGRFVVPEHRDLAIVEASLRAAMQKARRALIAGVPPRVVSKRFSEGPYDPGGVKLHYTKGTGAGALDRAIFSARPHVVVGPLRLYWYYVFEVLKVEPRRQLRLAEVEGEIKRTLAMRGLAEKLDSSLAQSWRPQTACQPGYLVADCRQ